MAWTNKVLEKALYLLQGLQIGLEAAGLLQKAVEKFRAVEPDSFIQNIFCGHLMSVRCTVEGKVQAIADRFNWCQEAATCLITLIGSPTYLGTGKSYEVFMINEREIKGKLSVPRIELIYVPNPSAFNNQESGIYPADPNAPAKPMVCLQLEMISLDNCPECPATGQGRTYYLSVASIDHLKITE